MAIEWTPWINVPMHCRLEVFFTAFAIYTAYFLGLISSIVIIYLLVNQMSD